MKTPEQRGHPVSAWAYEVRAEVLKIKPEEVVHRLGRYDPATVRQAEANVTRMSRPMWRALTRLYPDIAREQGKTLPPIPEYPEEQVSARDVDALVEALDRQTAALAEATRVWAEVGVGLAGLLGRVVSLSAREGTPDAS